MKKKLPKLRSNKEAEDFVASSDLTQYDLSGMRMARFEFAQGCEKTQSRIFQAKACYQLRHRSCILGPDRA